MSIFAFHLLASFFVIPRAQKPTSISVVFLQEAWCTEIELVTTQIALSDELIFARTPNHIFSLKKTTGEIVWKFQIRDDSSRVPPVFYNDGLLVVSSETSSIVLLYMTSG